MRRPGLTSPRILRRSGFVQGVPDQREGRTHQESHAGGHGDKHPGSGDFKRLDGVAA
jgi:hypothetical protein